MNARRAEDDEGRYFSSGERTRARARRVLARVSKTRRDDDDDDDDDGDGDDASPLGNGRRGQRVDGHLGVERGRIKVMKEKYVCFGDARVTSKDSRACAGVDDDDGDDDDDDDEDDARRRERSNADDERGRKKKNVKEDDQSRNVNTTGAVEKEIKGERKMSEEATRARGERERALSERDIAHAIANELRERVKVLENACARKDAEARELARVGEEMKTRGEASERASERERRRANEAEREAEDARRAVERMRSTVAAVVTASETSASAALVERVKGEILSARGEAAKYKEEARRLSEKLREALDARGAELESAKREGAQTFQTRMDAMTNQFSELEGELVKKTLRASELDRELARARAEFAELKRGAAFKVQTLERKTSEFEVVIEAMMNEKRECARECENFTARLAAAAERDADSARALERAERRVRALSAKAAAATRATEAMKTRRKGDRAKIVALTHRIESVRRLKRAAKARASSLVADNEASLTRIALLEVGLRDAEKVLARINDECADERERRIGAERASAQSAGEIEATLERLRTLESARDAASVADAATLALASKKNLDAEWQNLVLQEDIESFRRELAKAREDLATAATREQRLRWASREMESLIVGLRRMIDEQAAVIRERDAIELELASRDEALAEAEARASRLNVALANAESRLARRSEPPSRLSLDIDALTPRALARALQPSSLDADACARSPSRANATSVTDENAAPPSGGKVFAAAARAPRFALSPLNVHSTAR